MIGIKAIPLILAHIVLALPQGRLPRASVAAPVASQVGSETTLPTATVAPLPPPASTPTSEPTISGTVAPGGTLLEPLAPIDLTPSAPPPPPPSPPSGDTNRSIIEAPEVFVPVAPPVDNGSSATSGAANTGSTAGSNTGSTSSVSSTGVSSFASSNSGSSSTPSTVSNESVGSNAQSNNGASGQTSFGVDTPSAAPINALSLNSLNAPSNSVIIRNGQANQAPSVPSDATPEAALTITQNQETTVSIPETQPKGQMNTEVQSTPENSHSSEHKGSDRDTLIDPKDAADIPKKQNSNGEQLKIALGSSFGVFAIVAVLGSTYIGVKHRRQKRKSQSSDDPFRRNKSNSPVMRSNSPIRSNSPVMVSNSPLLSSNSPVAGSSTDMFQGDYPMLSQEEIYLLSPPIEARTSGEVRLNLK